MADSKANAEAPDQPVAPPPLPLFTTTTMATPTPIFPPEVLGEVFPHTLKFTPTTEPTSKDMEQLVGICLVSKEWRHAALHTHSLWSAIELTGPLGPRTIEKARQWLNRAKTVPKMLVLDLLKARHDYQCFDVSECALASSDLAGSLVDGTIDLFHLSVLCPSSICFLQLLRLMERAKRAHNLRDRAPSSWDRIQSLKLVFLEEWTEWDNFPYPEQAPPTSLSFPIFSQLPPTLTTFTLHLPFISYSNPDAVDERSLNIPEERLSHLTSLMLTCDWSAGKVLNVLRFCTNLRDFTLDLAETFFARAHDDKVQVGVDDQATLLPQVRRLAVQRVRSQGLQCLRYFRTPLLEELEVKLTEMARSDRVQVQWPDSAVDILGDFLRRSHCGATLNYVWLRHARLKDVRSL